MATAYEKKIGPLSKASDDTVAAFFTLVPMVNPWKRASEPLLAVPKQKFDGSDRWVYSAPVVDHAVHLLVKWALDALTDPEPTQFMSAGGRGALERWLRQELPGAARVITTDIPSCFENILRDELGHGLPIPGRVQKVVLFDPKDHARFLKRAPRGFAPMNKEEVAKVSTSGRGIPQGTAPSSIVSEIVIGPAIRAITAVSPDVRVASFGDNLIIILRNANDEVPAIQALTTSIKVPFGHEVIGRLTSRTRAKAPSASFSFCGRDYRWVKGKLRVRLSVERRDKFAIKVQVRINDAQRTKDPSEPDKIRRMIYGWGRANGGLVDVVETAHGLLCELDQTFKSGVSSDSDKSVLEGGYASPVQAHPPLVEAL